jgi:hypothetical protein
LSRISTKNLINNYLEVKILIPMHRKAIFPQNVWSHCSSVWSKIPVFYGRLISRDEDLIKLTDMQRGHKTFK